MDEQHDTIARSPSEPDPEEQLRTTADGWRAPLDDTEAEESGDEVARGAENAARQRGFGREGS